MSDARAENGNSSSNCDVADALLRNFRWPAGKSGVYLFRDGSGTSGPQEVSRSNDSVTALPHLHDEIVDDRRPGCVGNSASTPFGHNNGGKGDRGLTTLIR